MTLTASLVVIVFISGYTNFIAPVVMRENDGRPHWIAEIDFAELKLKLMASSSRFRRSSCSKALWTSATKAIENFGGSPASIDLRRLGAAAGARRLVRHRARTTPTTAPRAAFDAV